MFVRVLKCFLTYPDITTSYRVCQKRFKLSSCFKSLNKAKIIKTYNEYQVNIKQLAAISREKVSDESL